MAKTLTGTVSQVIGPVIDVHFPAGRLPAINNALTVPIGDKTLTVFVSTASPYKFCGPVLTAIGKSPVGSGLELLDQLHEATGVPVPRRLAVLRGKPRRFDKTVEKQAMETAVLDFLK